ncbi:hypothetical protein ABH922_003171 [Rhodococcus sp. 27YEA15]|uniref:anti-sigma-D factor RsdA n=1 Tax=Rhodococcus sp. 27YEA15 TaxID=3156259 RepID=UPI003C7B7171
MARDDGHDASNLGDLADDGTPMDLAAVRRDDALIEAISSGGPVSTENAAQYELALILSNWRDDVVSTPMPQGPSLDEVEAAIVAASIGSRPGAPKLRLVRPVAAAAATIAVLFGGATAFAYGAEPGDALWGVKQVVFSQEANSTVAKIDTTSELEKAERLLAVGDIPAAKLVLDNAAHRADDVKDSPEKTDLVERWGKLMSQVEQTDAPAAPPVAATTTNVDVEPSESESSTRAPQDSTTESHPPVTSTKTDAPSSTTTSAVTTSPSSVPQQTSLSPTSPSVTTSAPTPASSSWSPPSPPA